MASNDQKGRYRDISEGLLRQRRNLLLASLLLPLFFGSGAVIEQLSILGTTIEIQEPNTFKASLVFIFGYFFLRYWQYYREETFVKDMHRAVARDLYSYEIKFLQKKAKARAHFLEPHSIVVTLGNPRYRTNVWNTAIPELKEKPTFPFFRKCEVYISPTQTTNHSSPDIRAFEQEMKKHEAWHCVKNEHGQTAFYWEYVHYCVLRFYLMRIVGFIRYMLNESYFTDYQLPFLVAGASALITLYAAWS